MAEWFDADVLKERRGLVNIEALKLHTSLYFINRNIGVLSSRLLSLEGFNKTFIFWDGAFVGQVARLLRLFESFQR